MTGSVTNSMLQLSFFFLLRHRALSCSKTTTLFGWQCPFRIVAGTQSVCWGPSVGQYRPTLNPLMKRTPLCQPSSFAKVSLCEAKMIFIIINRINKDICKMVMMALSRNHCLKIISFLCPTWLLGHIQLKMNLSRRTLTPWTDPGKIPTFDNRMDSFQTS